jgi:hypothetical protein
MIMEYVLPILIFLVVLSPLFIPIGVTVLHAIRNWHPRLPVSVPSPRRRRLELAVEFD